MFAKIDKRIFLLIAVSILVAAGLIWLAVFFQFQRIRAASDNIQKEQLDSLVREQRNKKVLELNKELGDIGEVQNEMNALLIDKNNAVPFIETLEQIARGSGNTINISVTDLSKMKTQNAAKPKAAQESDDETVDSNKKSAPAAKPAAKPTTSQNSKQDFSNQLGFVVELNGRYPSLIDFLTKLENVPFFVRIYEFQSTPVDKKMSAQPEPTAEQPIPPESAQAAVPDSISKDITTTMTISVYTNGSK